MAARDLEEVFGALADQVPEPDESEENEDGDILFNADNLPRPPAELRTSRLAMQRGFHDYSSTPYESLSLYADKRTLRLLGLLILAKLFHEEPAHVGLQLGMPGDGEASGAIRRLILDYHSYEPPFYGYVTKPHRFRYLPGRPDKHPWFRSQLMPLHMPILYVTGESWDVGRVPGEKLDTAVGFGTDQGHVHFAELLLDASMPGNTRDEYALESESGFRGVGPGSAEIQIYLRGHPFHDDPVPWPETA